MENGVRRSWRVELLPFLGETELYAAYRRDEPWDSDANRRVLARMPAVYRHPADDRDGPFAAYFAAVGSADGGKGASAWRPESPAAVPTDRPPVTVYLTAEDGTSEPVRLADAEGTHLWDPADRTTDFADGTTNTVLVVEAKRDVPWTKPEDIAVDLTKPVPAAMVGGFGPGPIRAAFADGSVQTLNGLNGETLRALLTRNGGEIIDPAPDPEEPGGPELSDAQRDLAERWAAALRETRGHMPMAFSVAAGMVAKTDADSEAAAPLAAELAWPDLPGKDEKTGVLKAFAFSKGRPDQHPATVRALHLGMTDGGRDVREYAASYLEEFALKNFADDMPGYRAWYAQFAGRSVEEVRAGQRTELGALIDDLADAIAAGDGSVSREARTLAEKIAGFEDPAAIPELIGLLDSAFDVWDLADAKLPAPGSDFSPTEAGAKKAGLLDAVGSAIARLAKVPASPALDAAWWRTWWRANRDRFPDEVSRVDVPDYRERLRAGGKAAAE